MMGPKAISALPSPPAIHFISQPSGPPLAQVQPQPAPLTKEALTATGLGLIPFFATPDSFQALTTQLPIPATVLPATIGDFFQTQLLTHLTPENVSDVGIFLTKILFYLGGLAITWKISGAIETGLKNMVGKAFSYDERAKLWIDRVLMTLRTMTIVGGGLLTFAALGGTADMLTLGAGLFSAGVAYAFRENLENIATGLFLTAQKRYQVGDMVQIGSKKGFIIDLNWSEVTLLEFVDKNPDAPLPFPDLDEVTLADLARDRIPELHDMPISVLSKGVTRFPNIRRASEQELQPYLKYVSPPYRDASDDDLG